MAENPRKRHIYAYEGPDLAEIDRLAAHVAALAEERDRLAGALGKLGTALDKLTILQIEIWGADAKTMAQAGKWIKRQRKIARSALNPQSEKSDG